MHPTSKILQTGPRGWQRLAVTYTPIAAGVALIILGLFGRA
jgi:hypothetical protein